LRVNGNANQWKSRQNRHFLTAGVTFYVPVDIDVVSVWSMYL
jgi:hypothetical protein